MKSRTACIAAAAWLVIASVGVARAATVEDALAAALEDARAGRCDEATARLEAIPGLESRARLMGGRCRVDQADYEGALEDFDRAEAVGDLPAKQRGELNLSRAIALFHLERYDEADAALDAAEGDSVDAAQRSLYRGMIALRRNDNARAAAELEKAARLGPEATEPVAS